MAVYTKTIKANGLSFTASVGTGGTNLAAPDRADELVLFLHGFPHTRHTWRAELSALDTLGYRVAAFDQRGYSSGARPDGVEAYQIENLMADAFAIVETTTANAGTINGQKFHLVGHDWGGQLGWFIAALFPERIRSLSVISRPHPAAFMQALEADPDQAGRSKHHRSFQRLAATAEYLANAAALLRTMLADWGATPADIKAYLHTLGDHQTLDAAINWYRAMGQSMPQPDDVPTVTVPTLYVWGNQDTSVGRVAAEGTAKFVSGSYRFVEIPGGSHCITDQSPGLFVDLLLEHIRSN